jgi:3-hydroxyacyl-CoA dehydrogenase
MGSGIASHFANLGFRVSLLDSNAAALASATERLRMGKPPALYLPERLNDIRLGTLAESRDAIAEADWVIEAIYEDLDAKLGLFAQVVDLLKPDARLTTNTSGLPIAELAAKLPTPIQERFLGTHFFNPPRYLKLVEIIPGPHTSPLELRRMEAFLEEQAGKRVVEAKDTPGFIANRYGMACLFHAIHVTEKLRLNVEQVDAITGTFLDRPKTGTFRLADLIGLDVMRDIADGLIRRCPDDPFIGVLRHPNSVHGLLARGWLGEKSGHGYTRKQGKEILNLDLNTFAYRQALDVDLPTLGTLAKQPLGARIREALQGRDEVGEFLRAYLIPTLRYAEYLRNQISHDVRDFDRVMQWGFGWSHGPFELIEAIGPAPVGGTMANYYDSGRVLAGTTWSTPIAEPQYASLASYPVLEETTTYRLRDLGEGVHSIGLTTKLGVITPEAVQQLTALLTDRPNGRFVLTSESNSFSVGFDLTFFYRTVNQGRWREIDQALIDLQQLGERLETVRVVAAVHGHCLGAGLELALSCPVIIADAEAKLGFPEAKVGLIPGGRGTVLTRLNNQNSRWLPEVALKLAKGEVSLNADHAHRLGYLRASDKTSYHPDRLIYEAKMLAQSVEPRPHTDWKSLVGPTAGMIEQALGQAKRQGQLTDYDEKIGEKIKQVYAKPTNYGAAIARERQEFLDLCNKALSQARLRHMVEQKTPLRN